MHFNLFQTLSVKAFFLPLPFWPHGLFVLFGMVQKGSVGCFSSLAQPMLGDIDLSILPVSCWLKLNGYTHTLLLVFPVLLQQQYFALLIVLKLLFIFFFHFLVVFYLRFSVYRRFVMQFVYCVQFGFQRRQSCFILESLPRPGLSAARLVGVRRALKFESGRIVMVLCLSPMIRTLCKALWFLDRHSLQ